MPGDLRVKRSISPAQVDGDLHQTVFYLFLLKEDRKIPHSSINIEKCGPSVEGASLGEAAELVHGIMKSLLVWDAARRRCPATSWGKRPE